MKFWWVNQNQTYRHEIQGGYLWSPMQKKNGSRNPFYDFMREVAAGDIIFSFSDTWISNIGVARAHAYSAPKPGEFGSAGAHWDQIGWRVDVRFVPLRTSAIRPVQHIDLIRELLPKRYSPLRPDGGGMQQVYLTPIEPPLAQLLIEIMGSEARDIVLGRVLEQDVETLSPPATALVEWEEHQLDDVQADDTLAETEKQAVVLARRGQGLFKQRVMKIEAACRLTGVSDIEHLRASHCRPWRHSSNSQRLDGENGLLLTPNADHLFDRGYIGFEANGDLIVSPSANAEALRRMGVAIDRKVNVGGFSQGQKKYLEYHREHVLLYSAYMKHPL